MTIHWWSTALAGILLTLWRLVFPICILLIARLLYRTAPPWMWISLVTVAVLRMAVTLPSVLMLPFFRSSPFALAPAQYRPFALPLSIAGGLASLGLIAVLYGMALEIRRRRPSSTAYSDTTAGR